MPRLTAGTALVASLAVLASVSAAVGQASTCPAPPSTAPGGLVEPRASTAVRPWLSLVQIDQMLPDRGPFTFPAPYQTEGIRITNAADCNGNDCVLPVGYSYWRNINNHSCSDKLLIFLGMHAGRGGSGPTLFEYDKPSGTMTKLGPLFAYSDPLTSNSGEGWYFSATEPHALYVTQDRRLRRYDVIEHTIETVFDATAAYGSDKFIWQAHSSDDDRVHSATLRKSSNSEMLGCLVYREDTAQFSYYPKLGEFDECHVDKSGRWLVILENVDGVMGEDNRIIDLDTGQERILLDQEGAAGHADLGYGYMVNEDNWGALPGLVRLWKFDQPLVPGPNQGRVVYNTTDWGAGVGHVAHGNATDAAPEGQIVCSSNASQVNLPRSNEIVCYRVDGSSDVLVVAPVMTDLNTAGGGPDDYSQSPKGNLDVTGRYFIWTSNLAGNRLDAFLVRVPTQRLIASSDTTAPTVTLTTAPSGPNVTGTVTLTAAAADNVAVVGVRFKLDGQDLGTEDTAPPYTRNWNSSTSSAGAHVLTAQARDAAGNVTLSTSVSLVVGPPPDTTPPTVALTTAPSGPNVTGTVTLTAAAADNVAVVGVRFKLDGQDLGAEDTAPPYTRNWNSSSSSAGAHVLTAQARDAAGNVTLSTPVSLVVGPPPDTTPPTVALTTAPSGPNVTGTVTLTAAAADNVAVVGVRFKLDGQDLGAEDTAPPYTRNWNTSSSSAGAHVLTAQARDAAGNVTLSTPVTLVVAPPDTTPPVLSELAAIRIGELEASIRWRTNEPADARVEFGTTLAYGSSTPLATPLLLPHTLLLPGLSAGTLYHYRVLSRDAAGNLAVSSDRTFRTLGPTGGPPSVAWTSLVNCTASGGILTKTGGVMGQDDARAVSQQQLSAGNGHVEFTAAEVTTERIAGLNVADWGSGWGTIDFAVRLIPWGPGSGMAEVREKGVWRAYTLFAPGDRFRVAVESGSVRYYRNGALFYTSLKAPSYPMRADAAILDIGGTIQAATFSPGG